MTLHHYRLTTLTFSRFHVFFILYLQRKYLKRMTLFLCSFRYITTRCLQRLIFVEKYLNQMTLYRNWLRSLGLNFLETQKLLQKKRPKNRNDLTFFLFKSPIGILYLYLVYVNFLENHQKSPKKRNDLKFRNDLWVSTVFTLCNGAKLLKNFKNYWKFRKLLKISKIIKNFEHYWKFPKNLIRPTFGKK